MSAEQMPDGLELAVAHIEELRGIVAARYADLDGNIHPSRASRTSREVATCDEAIAAVRADHAQRVALQHHAADMAQALESEQQAHADTRHAHDNIARELFVQRSAQDKRIAELEAERENTAAHVASIARQLGDESLQVDDIAVRVLALVAERDALRGMTGLRCLA